MKFKLFCHHNHWRIENGQIILDTPTGKDKEAVKRMMNILELDVRRTVYTELCEIDLTSNRKQIVKLGIDKALLTVQDLLARRVLYKYTEAMKPKEQTIEIELPKTGESPTP